MSFSREYHTVHRDNKPPQSPQDLSHHEDFATDIQKLRHPSHHGPSSRHYPLRGPVPASFADWTLQQQAHRAERSCHKQTHASPLPLPPSSAFSEQMSYHFRQVEEGEQGHLAAICLAESLSGGLLEQFWASLRLICPCLRGLFPTRRGFAESCRRGRGRVRLH